MWSNGWGWLPAYHQHVERLGRCSRHGEAKREPALLRCAAERGHDASVENVSI